MPAEPATAAVAADPTPAVDPAPATSDPNPPAADPTPAVAADPTPAAGDPESAGNDPFYQSLPDDWRTQLAGEDEATVKLLERYNDLPSMVKALGEAKTKIRQGILNADKLPDDATEEQLAEWRQSHGIPDDPSGYDLKLDEGLVLSQEDAAIMDSVKQAAHGENIPTSQLGVLTNAMLKAREIQSQKMHEQDNLDASSAREMLKQQWGADFQTNSNLVDAFVSGMPAEIAEQFYGLRLPNGKALLNSPEVVDYLVRAQRAIDPAASVLPDGGEGGIASIDAEIKALEARMTEDGWHTDVEANARLEQLYEAQERLKSK